MIVYCRLYMSFTSIININDSIVISKMIVFCNNDIYIYIMIVYCRLSILLCLYVNDIPLYFFQKPYTSLREPSEVTCGPQIQTSGRVSSMVFHPENEAPKLEEGSLW